MSAFFWQWPSTMAFDVGSIQKVAALQKTHMNASKWVISFSLSIFSISLLWLFSTRELVILYTITWSRCVSDDACMCSSLIRCAAWWINWCYTPVLREGERERQKGRMYDSQLEEDGREEVEAREDQDVAMAAEMERSMVKKCVKW